MQPIRFEGFIGEFPRVDKRLLQANASQNAENMFLTSGRIDPMYQPDDVASTRSGSPKSIFRMYSGATNYWLNWLVDVDMVRGPVAGDTSFRVYFTSDTFEPRVTNLALATAGTPYPNSWYVLGVTPPVTKPNVTTAGGASANVTRVYCYTFVTQWGEESAPSPSGDADTAPGDATWTIGSMDVAPLNSYTITNAVWAGGTLTVTVGSTFGLRAGEYVTISGLAPSSLNASWKVASVTNTTTFTITMATPGAITDVTGSAARDAPHNTTSMTKRIYRSVTSATDTAFYYTKEVAVATVSTTDDATTIGEKLPTTDWDMPPVGLQGIRVLPSGALCGFSDNTLCFSEPYHPYAWPEPYELSTDYPIVGIGVFGQSVVVGTSGFPYLATGVEPETTTLTRLEQEWPCLCKRGVVEFNGGVYFPTNVGLALVSPAGAVLVTEPYFSQHEWVNLNPSAFIGACYDGDYYTIVDVATSDYVMVISDKKGVSRIALQPSEIYTDPGNGKLYLVYNELINELNATTGTFMTSSWTSKEQYLDRFTNFGAAKIEAEYGVTAAVAAATAASNVVIVAANAAIIATRRTRGAINGAVVNKYEVNGSSMQDLLATGRTLSFTLYVDGVSFFTKSVLSSNVFRLPGGKKYNNFYFNVSGNAAVRAVVIGESPTELVAV